MSKQMTEPQQSGAVVRVVTDRSKYPEIWVASNINIGRWYPDSESWIASSARHDFPDGADWYQLLDRGLVTLLAEADAETYEAGWRAGARAAALAAEEVEYEVAFPAGLVGADPADSPHEGDGRHGGGS